MRNNPRPYDKELNKTRHLIENFVAKLKQFRTIATRYDKCAVNFLGTQSISPLLSSTLIDDTPKLLRGSQDRYATARNNRTASHLNSAVNTRLPIAHFQIASSNFT